LNKTEVLNEKNNTHNIWLDELLYRGFTRWPAKYFYKKMYGFIGGEKVTASIIRIDTSISGSYYYDRYGKRLISLPK